jgi:hypothetical protein
MTLSQATRLFDFGDGAGTYSAQEMRLFAASLIGSLGGGSGNQLGIGSGVRKADGNPLAVNVTSGLSVQVAAGTASIQGNAATNAGAYTVVLDSAATLTCTAADTVNPRIDSVCLTVTDNGNNTSTSVVQIVTGTPAASPSAPALPGNSLLLANITVAANATTLSSGNISDQRQYMVAAGGIKPINSASFAPTAGSTSQYVHNINTTRLQRFNGSGLVAPSVAPFAPVAATSGNATANSTTAVTACSATVTVDGNTTVKLIARWRFISSSGTGAGNGCWVSVARGSTLIDEVADYAQVANGSMGGKGVTWYDTPAAGTYTYAVRIANQGAGTFTLNVANLTIEAQMP